MVPLVPHLLTIIPELLILRTVYGLHAAENPAKKMREGLLSYSACTVYTYTVCKVILEAIIIHQISTYGYIGSRNLWRNMYIYSMQFPAAYTWVDFLYIQFSPMKLLTVLVLGKSTAYSDVKKKTFFARKKN